MTAYAKLGIRSRAQAVAMTVDRGQSALIAESQARESFRDWRSPAPAFGNVL